MNVLKRFITISCLVVGMLGTSGHLLAASAEDGISGKWEGHYSRSSGSLLGTIVLIISGSPALVGSIKYSNAPRFGTDMKTLYDVKHNAPVLKFSALGNQGQDAVTTLEIDSNVNIMKGTMRYRGNDFDIWLKKVE